MNITFSSYELKNSDRLLFLNNELEVGVLCYEMIDGVELSVIRNETIELTNDLRVNINESGRIQSIEPIFQTQPEEKKYTAQEFLELIRPLLEQIENKILTFESIEPQKENKIVGVIDHESYEEPPIKQPTDLKILFTLLAIEVNGNQMYLNACKRLSKEILQQTSHDILITTNNVDFFQDLNSERVKVRNNINKTSYLNYGGEFNYNLKHYAFKNLPKKYEYLIYLDCDIKLDKWTEKSENFLKNEFSSYDFGADRLNCVLKDIVEREMRGEPNLFMHKVKSYDILSRYHIDDEIMEAKLPSEHFFIMRNDPNRVKKFQKSWEEMNLYLESKEGEGGSWGDGFEIGIAAKQSGFNSSLEMGVFFWQEILGFKFNGNKY